MKVMERDKGAGCCAIIEWIDVMTDRKLGGNNGGYILCAWEWRKDVCNEAYFITVLGQALVV